MAIKETGIAARAKETPAKSAQEMLRQARQEQKFMGISKDDNASTTGRLVNPPAAVIPNPNGAGGEAGATGFFGANLLSGANIQTSRTNVYGRPQPQPSGFVNPFSSNYIAQTYASPTIRAGGTLSGDKQGTLPNARPSVNFSGAVIGGGQDNPLLNDGQNSRYNMYGRPRLDTGGTLSADKQGSIPTQRTEIGGDKQSRLSSTPNTPPAWGTAGIYTYGQFSNKEDAFLTLMDKVSSYENAAGTSAGLTIPATIAQNLGLTEALQTPGSGWSLVNGAWVNDGSTPVTGGTDYSNVGTTDFTSTDFYKNYAANNVSFENQLRYDPATGRYISVGAWMQKKNDKQGYLARGDREAKLRQKREGARKMSWSEIQGSYEINNYYQPVEQTPSPFTGSWGVVNFNTGSG